MNFSKGDIHKRRAAALTAARAAPRWVLASHNPGKLKELSALLSPYEKGVVSAGALGLPEPAETETSFLGNARIKAHGAARASDDVALADDSGLVVTALGGAPGVYSADWAGPEKDFASAMARVLKGLASSAAHERSARFVCTLVLAVPDGSEAIFEGAVEGRIVAAPRGEGGFGYDPIFQPDGFDRTFAEMTVGEKQALSHRARAFEALCAAVFGEEAI